MTGEKTNLPADDPSNFHYDTAFTMNLASSLVDTLKEYVEYLAGARLSWWPLANPDRAFDADKVRVYSKLSVGENCLCLGIMGLVC